MIKIIFEFLKKMSKESFAILCGMTLFLFFSLVSLFFYQIGWEWVAVEFFVFATFAGIITSVNFLVKQDQGL